MRRFGLPQGWTWDGILLILGPILASLMLVSLYMAGSLPVSWPALLVVIVLINLAGDVVFAVRNERSLARGGANLRNDMVGCRVTAEDRFTPAGGSYRGIVFLSGERWQAACGHRAETGERLAVTGRRGLVLDVAAALDS